MSAASVNKMAADPGEEPTDGDMKRMDLIHKELEAFRKEMELRVQRAPRKPQCGARWCAFRG